jgi:hypothetical protein
MTPCPLTVNKYFELIGSLLDDEFDVHQPGERLRTTRSFRISSRESFISATF